MENRVLLLGNMPAPAGKPALPFCGCGKRTAQTEEDMKALTPAQVESYRHNGYLFPFPALSDPERAVCLAGLERYEWWLGSTVPQADLKWRTQPHALLPWYADLV